VPGKLHSILFSRHLPNTSTLILTITISRNITSQIYHLNLQKYLNTDTHSYRTHCSSSLGATLTLYHVHTQQQVTHTARARSPARFHSGSDTHLTQSIPRAPDPTYPHSKDTPCSRPNVPSLQGYPVLQTQRALTPTMLKTRESASSYCCHTHQIHLHLWRPSSHSSIQHTTGTEWSEGWIVTR